MKYRSFLRSIPILFGLTAFSHANQIVVGDVTAVLGPDFFFDTAAIGGGDHQAVDAVFVRDFGIQGYTFNPNGTEVTITGIGWASPSNQVLASEATVTITYLGSDGVLDGDDDVLIGSVLATIPTNNDAGERVLKFDEPMTATISGTRTNFRIEVVTGGETIRYKTTTGTTAAAVKLSVGGFYTSPALTDTDGDGIPDVYETDTGVWVSPFDTGTDPALADSDGDGLPDGVETNTGVWVGQHNTGTDPNNPDTDGDGLSDGVETNTGVFVSMLDTGTNPLNRDTDNDRLNDGFEVVNGLNPFANEDFDGDGFRDGIEVLFYGTDPKDALSFPGDGTSPEPGSFTPILADAFVTTSGAVDTEALGLGPALVNEAAGGGNDFDYTGGNTNFIVHYPELFQAAGSDVSLTGFAWPVVAPVNTDGDILLQFFDPGPSGQVGGIDRDVLVGTARGSLVVTGSNAIMYWKFDEAIGFTSSGTGLVVKIQSTGGLRFKAQNNFASGLWRTNDGRSAIGAVRTSRFTITGTAVAPVVGEIPVITNITRSGNSTQVIWDLNGAPSVTLQRSTTLQGFINVEGKINTTDTSHEESSNDPKAFFRLTTP